jgi:hypothetical protein
MAPWGIIRDEEARMATNRVLTESERKAFDEADAIFGRAYQEATSKLAAAGLRLPDDADPRDTTCVVGCGCREFVVGGHMGKCGRVSCGHAKALHGRFEK